MKRIGTLLPLALTAPYASGQVVHSVCQLLLNPAEHSGEVIRLRGVLLEVPSIGTVIADPGCREMPSFLDENWEPAVWFSQAPPADQHPHDLDALWAWSKQAAAAHQAVRATFEGVLRYCLVPNALPDGHGIWWGCGNGNYYSLGFVVRAARDLTIEPNPFPGNAWALPPKDPAPGTWLNIRAVLTNPGGSSYFAEQCKDARFPYFAGKLISASPERAPTRLVLAITDGDTPDAILDLDGPLSGPAQPGTVIAFGGVAKAYTSNPFTLTFSVDRSYLGGWPGPSSRLTRDPF